MNETESTACAVIGSELTKNVLKAEKPTTVSGIYGLWCRVTGKWYVGQSVNIEKRWRHYNGTNSVKKQRKLHAAFVKHGPASFDKIVLELVRVMQPKRNSERWLWEERVLSKLERKCRWQKLVPP